MKKFVSIMAVALVAVLALTALAACGGGYPDDPAKAKEKLEKDGYTILNYEYDEEAEEGIVAMISAQKVDGSKTKMVSIAYYATAAEAKAEYEDSKEEIEKTKKLIEAMAEAMDLEFSMKVTRSGRQLIVEMSGATELLENMGGAF